LAFCTKCGKQLGEGVGFCTNCGTRVEAPANRAPAPPISAIPLSPAVVQPAAAPTGPSASPPVAPRKSGNLLLKIVVAVLGFFALGTVLVIGSCFYIGYRVKKKAEQVQEAYKKSDAGKVLGAIEQGQPGSTPDLGKILGALGQPGAASAGKFEARPPGVCPSGDRTGFDDYVKAAASASIPLVAGMTLTDIWSPRAGQADVEVLTTVNSVQSSTVEATGMRLVGDSEQSNRSLCIADLLNGREYETGFGREIPNTIPGATMFTLSKAVFDDLKAGRAAELTYYDAYNRPTGGYELRDVSKGTLTRIEPGASKDLPTIHAKGTLGPDLHEAWVLDDAANPLVLKFVDTTHNFHIDYVKITFPVKKEVEQQLAQTGRAEIYGIYFDSGKDVPRPESAPVLKEIASALKDNPGWKLEIGGNTDNIGGDAYNLALSQRRAEGVMHSLVTQYGIAADRLTAKGYGATLPKATNDTVEGRALNRRVELVRE
jgi:hypothetical protein